MDDLRWKLGFLNLPKPISQWTLIILWIYYLWILTSDILYLRYTINTVLNLSNILGNVWIYVISLVICNKTTILGLLLGSSSNILVCKVNVGNYAFRYIHIVVILFLNCAYVFLLRKLLHLKYIALIAASFVCICAFQDMIFIILSSFIFLKIKNIISWNV